VGNKKIEIRAWIKSATVFLLWVAYMLAHPGLVRPAIPLGRRTIFFIALSTIWAASILTADVSHSLDPQISGWFVFLVFTIGILCATFLASFIGKSATKERQI
jgi:CDP-diglyceride synthetase